MRGNRFIPAPKSPVSEWQPWQSPITAPDLEAVCQAFGFDNIKDVVAVAVGVERQEAQWRGTA